MLKSVILDSMSIRKDWRSNYAYYGGVYSVINCLMGYLRVVLSPTKQQSSQPSKLDCITFSVVPLLAYTWMKALRRTESYGGPYKYYVGDCCGGLKGLHLDDKSVKIIPMLNLAHGQKLDLFINKFSDSQYVLISDDDIFFLKPTAILWAIKELDKDICNAVVSFVPRERFTWTVNGNDYQPMGSYCLIIRRDTWLKEELSFRTVKEPNINPKSYKGEYDTADYANVELIKKRLQCHYSSK